MKNEHPRKHTLRHNVVDNIAVLFLSIVLTLGTCEMLARVLYARKDKAVKNFLYDPLPNGKQPKGFRRPIPAYPKSENTFRVIALGDSFTWGDKIKSPADLWPSILETYLREKYPSEQIEVINLGLRGFSTVNELELFTKIGLAFDPDIVIIQYTLNDPILSDLGFKNYTDKWLDNLPSKPLIPFRGLHERILAVSKFYKFLDFRFRALQDKINNRTMFDPLYADDFTGWIDCRKSMFMFSALSKKFGFDLLMAVFPDLPSGKFTVDSYPYKYLHDKITKAASNAGIDVIDLLPGFVEENNDFAALRSLGGYDGHPNEKAQRLCADILFRHIVDNGLLISKQNI